MAQFLTKIDICQGSAGIRWNRLVWEASCAEVAIQDSKSLIATDGDGVNGNNRFTPTFARLELENDDDLVFEVRAAIKAQVEVMATHAISKQSNILPSNPKYV